MNKAEYLISDKSLNQKINISSSINKANAQVKKLSNEVLVRKISISTSSNPNLKLGKNIESKTATVTSETKNNLFVSSTVNKKSTVGENLISSNIPNVPINKENLTKLAKNHELIYESIRKCKCEISLHQENVSFQKSFSFLSDNNSLINNEIQSRRKRKKASKFISNLEKYIHDSDQYACNSNTIKLCSFYLNTSFLIKHEIQAIQTEQKSGSHIFLVF